MESRPGSRSHAVALPPVPGRQRITSLYGIIRGQPPQFFEGNKDTFTGLHFNLEDETFEFYAPLKMQGPMWIDVSELMRKGIAEAMQRILASPGADEKANEYINRLNAIHGNGVSGSAHLVASRRKSGDVEAAADDLASRYVIDLDGLLKEAIEEQAAAILALEQLPSAYG